MFTQEVLEKLFKKCPETAMTRAILENTLSPELADQVFEDCRDRQYQRTLLFSTIVALMGQVVCGVRKSFHKAILAAFLQVSPKSAYNKLNSTEPLISAELLRTTAKRMTAILDEFPEACQPLLPGYQTRILDGNHLAATEHRIGELRLIGGGPLPGQALVVYDADRKIVRNVYLEEDAHAQERSIVGEVLSEVEAGDLWIADRNFCTSRMLFEIAARRAFFLIRRHAQNVRFRKEGSKRRVGETETGVVYEQPVVIENDFGEEMSARLVTVQLFEATRDDDWELEILCNLPAEVTAVQIADLYRKRWQIETAFCEVATTFEAEIPSLGHPRAALLAFSLGLIAYNVIRVMRASMEAAHGRQTVEETVSSYQLVGDVQYYWGAFDALFTPAELQDQFGVLSPKAMAKLLLRLAKRINLAQVRKFPRGPKKDPPERSYSKHEPHVSTARILARKRKA